MMSSDEKSIKYTSSILKHPSANGRRKKIIEPECCSPIAFYLPSYSSSIRINSTSSLITFFSLSLVLRRKTYYINPFFVNPKVCYMRICVCMLNNFPGVHQNLFFSFGRHEIKMREREKKSLLKSSSAISWITTNMLVLMTVWKLNGIYCWVARDCEVI